MTNQDPIQKLITVGRSIENNAEPSGSLIRSLEPYSHINTLSPDEAVNVSTNLANDELISLLLGITYVERELEWPGGSVAVTNHLFPLLLTRDIAIEQINNTADWIIKNTDNNFLRVYPVHESDARSYYDSDSKYREAMERQEAALQRLAREEAAELKRTEIEAEKQRQKRKLRRLTGNNHRNSPIRTELINKLNLMPVHDQIVMIAKDDIHAPNFYPTRCADSASMEIIESLSNEVKQILVLKLKGRHRGPWGVFKKRLLSVYDPASNHK